MRLGALVYLYRRRLRVHGAQELLAGLGIASSVALVFATLVASASVAGSSAQLVHTVIGPATLQLRARGSDGFPEAMLRRVERLEGVKLAAPLLEQTATIQAPNGRRLTVDLAGADTALTVLDGLAHTLPIATLAPGGIGLSRTSAETLGISTRPAPPRPTTATVASLAGPRPRQSPAASQSVAPLAQASAGSVTLLLRGEASRLSVSDVLGPEAFGLLARAQVAVMPLRDLQRLSGLEGRVSRILVQVAAGREAVVRAELLKLAAGRIDVAAADQDAGLLRQALHPSDQASALFATISVLLGVLFAVGALLLTVPERRRAIADLRLIGTRRSAIVQMIFFQALCLGVVASLIGLAGGYVLSVGVLHQSSGYLNEAFTLGTRTLVTPRPLLLAFGAGVLATCVASAVPLLDLRRSAALDAVYRAEAPPGAMLAGGKQPLVALAAATPLVLAVILFATSPGRALSVCELLALATVLAMPLALAAVLWSSHALAERRERLTALPVALASLRATQLRSLALAGTGALALFGAVALGGARADLLRGVQSFAHTYATDADVWVGTPGDNQATVDFRAGDLARRVARVPGVASVQPFQGGFAQLGGRRVWLLARPADAARELLAGQIVAGNAASAAARLSQGGWITISEQIAQEEHVGVGGTLVLPTPDGTVGLKVAATTTNFAWSPGAILIDEADYSRLWATSTPTALDVRLQSGADAGRVTHAIEATLGPNSGLKATTSTQREASIDALTNEGLSRLGEISTLLLLAAMLAMAAALTSAIWQRRTSLATLRLSGVRPRRVRTILLVESALMLGAGCITGALAGVFGQIAIDRYLDHVTGFPVASVGTSLRPIEMLALVIVVVLAIVAIPAWLASRVSPTLALNE
jgi:putative ABC transport system permease protein